jgi:NAD(P)-dependent dehydrogenase (short-subunit alcohol dehydrogenase family)
MKDQKVWFITGASSGFGFEISKAALEAGDKVAATIRDNTQKLSELANRYSDLYIVKLDVTKEEEVKTAVQKTLDRFGRLDIIVNNAGYGIVGGIEEIADSEARKQYDTNVFGVLNVIRAVLPTLRKQRSGHIINTSSLFAFDALPGWALYGSTKFAVEGISQGLAKELEPFGIKVTAIEPGLFSTEFTSKGSYVTPRNPISDYEQTMVGQMRHGTDSFHGTQQGDPVKLAAVVIKLGHSEKPPLHLPIGPDSVKSYKTNAANLAKDIDAWMEQSMSTDRSK